MPHDQAYYEAEKKIEQALKSDTTELTIRHPFIRSAKQSVENKGGKHGA